jgi:LuxR family maltose regulon positive regulatory protein
MTAAAAIGVESEPFLAAGVPRAASRELTAQQLRPFADARDGRPPVIRGAVRRSRLVTPLVDPGAPPLVVLIAPAGCGKTTVLCEWAARDARPFAWLTLDHRDNDATRLIAAVTRAVDAVRPAAGDGRFVLVLDDLHVLHSPEALDVLLAIATDLPPDASLALASRTEPCLPLARWRTLRLVNELGATELAMNGSETGAMLRHGGVELNRDGVDAVCRKTEGWPAGVVLAGLVIRDRGRTDGPGGFDGAERLVADYVREEILCDLQPGTRQFVLRTSILETLTGSSCDAVTGRPGSAAMLSELARSGMLLARLDRRGERYRYHALLAEALRAELRRVSPELERELHRRASAWHDETGDVDSAIRHALAGGDARRAGALAWRGVASAISHGQARLIGRWLDRFTDGQVATIPELALAKASWHLVRGEGDMVEHWAAAAAAAAPDERPAPIHAAITAIRAAAGHDGLRQMRDDAASAAELASDSAGCRAFCSFISGVAAHLGGAREGAEHDLQEGARRAAVTAPGLHALCLTQLAVLALEREDWEDAASLVTRARAQVDRFGLAEDATMALVFAGSALVRAQRGRFEVARSDFDVAARLGDRLTDFAPWYEIEVRVLLARAALLLCDASQAHARLTEASRLIRRVPEAGALAAWLAETWAHFGAFTASESTVPYSLTTAELRILRFLPTHLTFREIGEQTHVSANTVKTQAQAIYRKLDASCRSAAVTRARGLGLVDPR